MTEVLKGARVWVHRRGPTDALGVVQHVEVEDQTAVVAYEDGHTYTEKLEDIVTEGTLVTAESLDGSEKEVQLVRNAPIIITDGRCYLDHVQYYGNGTQVFTVKRQPKEN